MDDNASRTHFYFVDEAGDLTLFNKKGQPLLGRDGNAAVNIFREGDSYRTCPVRKCWVGEPA